MKVFSTLSGQKEEFWPQGDVVKMYVCGVTPYDDAHLGHAMSYIIFDMVRRYLKHRGYRVRYVQNITDIDDKIIDRANRLGIPPKDLAERFTSSFFADLEALNIEPADVYPRATEEVNKMIEVIQGLVDRGCAYPAGGSVYFRVRNVPDYGKLSRRSLDSMMAGARIEVGEEKEHPMDFVLWKAAKPGEPSWDSPWGAGRPGWHIECTSMSLRYLGETLDIHGGGQDLIFPHHENEIAQSESFTGVKPFVKYWLHNGLVQIGQEKMSKSLGNLVSIKEALLRYSADAIRLFVLSSHYRSPLTYTEGALEAAEKGVERLRQALRSAPGERDGAGETSPDPFRQRFIEAMDDDFNTAQALAAMFDLAREIHRAGERGAGSGRGREALKEMAGVLGLTLQEPAVTSDAAGFIELLISVRKQLREARQWQLADEIRAGLDELGVALEDTPGGTAWKRRR
ncbi:MAG: cysteine--tRNA ligase [Chloroflexi bacterium]|nr:cysteine--tRNA ligase [Chloroflexota bacterium]